jgi:hypothetical protein
MNRKGWRAVLVLALSLLAGAPSAEELASRRVVIQLAQGDLPDPEALVQALTGPQGEHRVKVKLERTPQGEQLQLDLWGSAVADGQIAATLKGAFPQLASADIQVQAVPPGEPSTLEGEEAPQPGQKVIIKKTVTRTGP